MVYVAELATGQRIYVEQQGSQTVVTLASHGPQQQQQSSSSFFTGTWTAPPEIRPAGAGAVVILHTADGERLIQVQGGSMAMSSAPNSGAEAPKQPMSPSSMPPMQPMPPMAPMQPMQPMTMGDMQMSFNPMEMRMGNMEMRIGAATSSAAPSGKRFCSQCGSAVTESDRFCSHCGHSLQAGQASQ